MVGTWGAGQKDAFDGREPCDDLARAHDLRLSGLARSADSRAIGSSEIFETTVQRFFHPVVLAK